ncbi:MAG TPA: SIS domain-containing protein [Desulfuromonadaceae bacterium]
MESTGEQSGIETFSKAVHSLETQVIESQRELLGEVAARMAKTVAGDGRIFVFGTGHSHMLMEEGFYRAGGLPAVVMLSSTALMVHENPILSGRLERMPGLADSLLSRYNPQPDEMIFVFSNSGTNHLPVEMALLGHERGLGVVSVCSMAYARVAPLSAIGKRLYEVADYALDNGGQPGDALVPVPGSDWRVGPSSTIINALLWNCLVVETIWRLQRLGQELPVIASLNMTGAAEHNEKLFAKWRKINPQL